MLSVSITILTVLLVVVSLLMILIVLMQRPKQEGLGAAFGGGMMNDSFGAHTTDILQKGTVWLSVMFFSISILLGILYTKQIASRNNVKVLDGVNQEQLPPTPTPAPSIGELPIPGATTPPPATPEGTPDGTSPTPAPATREEDGAAGDGSSPGEKTDGAGEAEAEAPPTGGTGATNPGNPEKTEVEAESNPEEGGGAESSPAPENAEEIPEENPPAPVPGASGSGANPPPAESGDPQQ